MDPARERRRPARYLLVDGGRTACRAAVFEGEKQVASASTPGLPYRRDGSLDPILAALGEAIGAVRARTVGTRHGRFDTVVLGLASIDTPELAALINAHVRSLVEASGVLVTVDVVTNYVGAVGMRPGTVVAAGTGVIALAVAEAGSFARADGWGYILGDDGSGYDIGRQGLAAALRTIDGRGNFDALREKAERRFGPLEEVSRRVYEATNPVGLVAGFAPDVAAAAREGDPAAGQIWTAAASEIARTTIAATSRVFRRGASVRVSWTGGLFAEEELLLAPFRERVAGEWPSAELCSPRAGPIAGALALARTGPSPLFEPLVSRFDS
ncbi:MAG: ATPase [Chloroflexota bacterium]|nr:ATPase [Chloroflexota bacterium]